MVKVVPSKALLTKSSPSADNAILCAFSIAFSISAIIIVYSLQKNLLLSRMEIPGTSLGDAFVDPEYVIYGVICTISVTAIIALELILDFVMEYGHTKVNDQGERLMMVLVVIIPGFYILKYAHNPNIPYIFCCLHSVQVIGSAAPIFSLCCKLVPMHFTCGKALVSYCFWAAAGTFMFIGFHQPLNSWANLLVFICVFISIGIFTGMVYSWGKELVTRVPPASVKRYFFPKVFASFTEDECCCVVYLGCALATIVMVPAITGAIRLYKWEEWTLLDLCVNIYALAGFSVLSGVIPGRYRQHMARKHIERKVQENHDTIRYISHEIRTPLNIVKNGVALVISNLAGHCHPEILEDLEDIEHASCAATSIVDDLLNFEKLEAKAFQVERHYEHAASQLIAMANRCQTLAQQKNIHFEVQNQIGCSEDGETLFILVDVIKMEQVIRNLIINSIKFTPEGGSICVSFRHETPSVLAGADISSSLSGRYCFESRYQFSKFLLEKVKDRYFYTRNQKIYVESQRKISIKEFNSQTVNEKKEGKRYNSFGTICIDISDTGVGLSPSQLKDMFGQFVQFNANHLQGGGGSGLGLWICKSIIEQHEGILTLKSDGPGLGTTFTVQLKCYLESSFEKHACSNAQQGHSFSKNSRPEIPDMSLHCDETHNFCSLPKSSAKIHEFQTVLQMSPNQAISKLSVRTGFGNLCQPEPLMPPPNAGRAVRISPINILVVDDSDLNRKIMKNIIKKIAHDINEKHRSSCHFEVFEADDGTSALELMKACSYGLILIDNIMKHMNGPEAVKHMRQLGYTGLVMGVTGNVSDADINNFKAHGANAVLKKPVSIEILSKILLDLAFQED